MSVCDSTCRSCIYSSTVSETEPVTCDYILVTGNRRGCPAGEGCERYIKGDRAPSIDQQLYKGRKVESKPQEKPQEKPKEQKPRKKKVRTPEQLAKKREDDKAYYQKHKKELNKRRYEREKQKKQSP